jgi:hypothetical protein
VVWRTSGAGDSARSRNEVHNEVTRKPLAREERRRRKSVWLARSGRWSRRFAPYAIVGRLASVVREGERVPSCNCVADPRSSPPRLSLRSNCASSAPRVHRPSFALPVGRRRLPQSRRSPPPSAGPGVGPRSSADGRHARVVSDNGQFQNVRSWYKRHDRAITDGQSTQIPESVA